MKAVMISIQPQYVDKIISGKKTIEVRKSRPNTGTPFKCYIYETKGKKQYWSQPLPIPYFEGKGKVIGEFICDCIEEFKVFENGSVQYWNYNNLEKSCLTYDEISNYIGKNKKGYALYILDLKIYDKPKEITSFYKCPRAQCDKCYGEIMNERLKKYGRCAECLRLTRPPQSWCYVEVIG